MRRGPNWVHGTENNPIVKIAKEANSRLCLIDDTTRVYSPHGLPWSDEKATAGFEEVWNILLDAFKYSNESCPSITSGTSLKDFFKAKLAEQSLDPESQDQILLLAEMWGAFIGDSWGRQSLKWFWLEECLDGGNALFELPCGLKYADVFSKYQKISSSRRVINQYFVMLLRMPYSMPTYISLHL